jgi:putative hydrolase of the HAD superfamily
MKRVIFFDLGNTLIYDDQASWADVYVRADRSLRDILHKFDINFTSHELFGKYGTLLEYYYNFRKGDLQEPGIGTVLKGLLDERNIHISDENLQSSLRSMYAVTQTNWYLDEDAKDTLEILLKANNRLGIISNGSDDLNMYELLDKLNLRNYFEFILSSAAFGKRKPYPGIFRAGLDFFHVSPDEAVMVGDNYEADILGARRLGMNTIWFTRHLDPPPDDSNVRGETVVTRLSEIPALLPQDKIRL